jgi:hypothetical protein
MFGKVVFGVDRTNSALSHISFSQHLVFSGPICVTLFIFSGPPIHRNIIRESEREGSKVTWNKKKNYIKHV